MLEFVLIVVFVLPTPDAMIVYHPEKFTDETKCNQFAQTSINEMAEHYHGVNVQIMAKCVPFKTKAI